MEIKQLSFLDTKTCSKCGESKPLSEFYAKSWKPGSYYALCKECNRLKRREEYQSGKEKAKVYMRHYRVKYKENCLRFQRDYRRRHPEINANAHRRYFARKRANGGSYTRQEWIDLCAKYSFRCVACGGKRKLVADHIIPVSKGGSTTIGNTQPLCIPCNSRKGDAIIDYR